MKSLSGSELHLSLRMDSRSTFLHQARDPSFPDAKARRFSAISRPIFSVSSVRSLPPPFRDLVFFFFRSDFTKGLIHGGSLEDIRIDFLGKHSFINFSKVEWSEFTAVSRSKLSWIWLLIWLLRNTDTPHSFQKYSVPCEEIKMALGTSP